MPTTEYPKNPNTDTAFVTDDNNHRTRAVKTVQLDGTIDYPKNSNSDSCYVTVDGKKQRALMVADISSEGTLDYPTNSNSTKGYVTVNGKKQRVTLTASLVGGGSAPVIEELNVTPSTSAQTITAPQGTDGYSPVNVSAVTSAIDANISAGNIKKDVTILGVTGSYEGVAPSGTKQITSNGIHDVAGYANADVQVPTTAPAHYIEKAVDANGKLVNSSPFIDLTGVTDVGDYVLHGQYYHVTFPANTTINMSAILSISGENACSNMFNGASNVGSIYLSSLTTISGQYACSNMFQNSLGITSVDLSALTSILGGFSCQTMFDGSSLDTVVLSSLATISGTSACNGMFRQTKITSISFPSLTSVSGLNVFNRLVQDCPNLIQASFPQLSICPNTLGAIYQQPFGGTLKLESVSFGGLKASTFSSAVNQFQYLFSSNTGQNAPNGCTIHFPSNFDPSDPNHTFDASTLTGYPTFGGNASYIHVAFDLPATE